MPRPHVTSAGAGCSTADVVRLSRERTHPTVVSPPRGDTEGRCPAGHAQPRNVGCTICRAHPGEPCNGGEVRRHRSLNATPLRAQRRRQVRILQDASTEASRLWAAAIVRGHDDQAAMYEERAMALAAGAAALQAKDRDDA